MEKHTCAQLFRKLYIISAIGYWTDKKVQGEGVSKLFL